MSGVFSTSPGVQGYNRPANGAFSFGQNACFGASSNPAQTTSLLGQNVNGASSVGGIEEYVAQAVMQIVEKVLVAVIQKLEESFGIDTGMNPAGAGAQGLAGASPTGASQGDSLGGIGDFLQGILGDVLGGTTASGAETAASATGAAASSSGGGFLDGLLSKGKDLLGGLFSKGKDAFGGILSGIGSYASSFMSGVGSFFSGIGSFFGF